MNWEALPIFAECLKDTERLIHAEKRHSDGFSVVTHQITGCNWISRNQVVQRAQDRVDSRMEEEINGGRLFGALKAVTKQFQRSMSGRNTFDRSLDLSRELRAESRLYLCIRSE